MSDKEVARQTLQQAMADLDRAQANLERLGPHAVINDPTAHKAAEGERSAAARRYIAARDHLEELDRK
jgi:hypothetical protein